MFDLWKTRYYIEYEKDPLAKALIRGIVMKAGWHAYKIYEEEDNLIVKWLTPLRGEGRSVYLPFLFGGYEVKIIR